jgi:hypothetical protein
MRGVLGALSLTIACCAVAVAPASASELAVSKRAGSFDYLTGPGERNVVTVKRVGRHAVFTDRLAIEVTRGRSLCTHVTQRAVRCPLPRTAVIIRMSLGAGDDRAEVSLRRPRSMRSGDEVRLEGGAGNDRLVTGVRSGFMRAHGEDGDDYLRARGPLVATLYGGPGRDRLYGARGQDGLFGGAGDDLLHGGPAYDILVGGTGANRLYGDAGDDQFDATRGRDTIAGGRGSGDWVEYLMFDDGPPVAVTLDGQANDGPSSAPDALRGDVEGALVYSNRPGNLIVGNDAANSLSLYGVPPTAGADPAAVRAIGRVDGGGGGDTLSGVGTFDGGEGDDVLHAGGGSFDGAAGNDTLEKAPRLGSPPWPAELMGGSGDDAINSQDPFCDEVDGCFDDAVPDSVACGDGIDAVVREQVDAVAADCENVSGAG